MKTYYAPVSIQKDAHGAAKQQCKSILETIMIQLDNDGKINTILYALHVCGEHIYRYKYYLKIAVACICQRMFSLISECSDIGSHTCSLSNMNTFIYFYHVQVN